MHTYKQSEPGLWTVGHYGPSGQWLPESGWETATLAANRVTELNGGNLSEPPVGNLISFIPGIPKEAGWYLAACDDSERPTKIYAIPRILWYNPDLEPLAWSAPKEEFYDYKDVRFSAEQLKIVAHCPMPKYELKSGRTVTGTAQ